MKAIITFLAASMVVTTAFANDFAAVLGYRTNSADLAIDSGTTSSVTSKSSFGAGVLGFFDVGQNFKMRTGLIYNQRNFSVSPSSGTAFDAGLSYMDIPVTAMFQFSEYGGAFAGPVLGLFAGKECSGACSFTKSPESMIWGLQFGASFKFAPQLGAELYYETIPSEFWKEGLKSNRTVGLNLLITFE